MTFLAPIPALIAGAVALPVLLTLYFLKLRRRPIRVSSVALWERAAEDVQVNVPFRWIRASWLLLLHLLVLLALLAALARPTIELGGLTPERIYILIDRSASMQADDQADGRTRLDEAKRLARESLDQLARRGFRGETVVIAFAAEPVALTPPTTDLGQVRAAIAGIEPTDEPADLPAALRIVDALAQAGLTDDEEDLEQGEDVYAALARVLLFSDGGFDLGAEPATLANAMLTYTPVGATTTTDAFRPNRGVVALAARRDFDDPARVRVFARVQHNAPVSATVPVSLLVDGQRVRTRAIELPPRSPDGTPGQSPVTMELDLPGRALLELRLPEGDPLASDDAGVVWMPAPRRPGVLLVAPDRASMDLAGQMIEDILRELEPSRLDRVTPTRAEAILADSIAASAYDLIIYDRAEPAGVPPLPSLHFGAGVPAEGLILEADEDARPTGVATWRRGDPLLRDVALDRVRVARPLRLRTEAPASERPITELASGAQTALIVRAEPTGRARVLVAFDPAQSNWPIEVGFALFLASAVEQLTGLGDGASAIAHRTGEPIEAPLPPELRGRTNAAIVGLGEARRLTLQREDRTARLGRLSRVGVYRFQDAPGAPPIAVNLFNPSESALIVRDRLTVSGRVVEGVDPARGGRDERGPREIWHWFALLAVALLAIEWLVYGVQSRV